MPETHDIWQGERVHLRGIEPEDWETFYAIARDSEVERLGHRVNSPQSREAARRWAEERARERHENDDDAFLCIARSEDDAVLGSISVHGADRRNRRFQFGLALGREHWRHGYGREAIQLLLRYYFGELGYAKAECGVYAFNERSIAFHRALGFVEEGRLRSAIFAAGRRWDEVRFGMTADEFAERHPGFAPSLPDAPPRRQTGRRADRGRSPRSRGPNR